MLVKNIRTSIAMFDNLDELKGFLKSDMGIVRYYDDNEDETFGVKLIDDVICLDNDNLDEVDEDMLYAISGYMKQDEDIIFSILGKYNISYMELPKKVIDGFDDECFEDISEKSADVTWYNHDFYLTSMTEEQAKFIDKIYPYGYIYYFRNMQMYLLVIPKDIE